MSPFITAKLNYVEGCFYSRPKTVHTQWPRSYLGDSELDITLQTAPRPFASVLTDAIIVRKSKYNCGSTWLSSAATTDAALRSAINARIVTLQSPKQRRACSNAANPNPFFVFNSQSRVLLLEFSDADLCSEN